jgi:hypothetical protein
MLHVGQDGKQRETRVGLPMVEISEKGEDVGLLLRYCPFPQAARQPLSFERTKRCAFFFFRSLSVD